MTFIIYIEGIFEFPVNLISFYYKLCRMNFVWSGLEYSLKKQLVKLKKRPDIYNVSCFINEKDGDVSFLTKLLFMHVFCCNFMPP